MPSTHRRAWSLALGVGAALVMACAPRVPQPAPQLAAPASMRVLVLNMHAGMDANGQSNLDSVAALVRDVRADLVLLQEVDSVVRRSGGVDQPSELARRTGFHAAFGSSLAFQGGQYGIAVLSRWPVAAHAVVHLPVAPPQERSGGSMEPRTALHVQVRTPAGLLHVLNTHLDPSGDDHWRGQEADSVLAYARRLAAAGAAVLVGGDFNSTPESAVQQRLRAGGLRDLWEACGQGDGLTYPADTPVKRIDYLYMLDPARGAAPAAGSMGCERAEVLLSQASDHRAVLFEGVGPRNALRDTP